MNKRAAQRRNVPCVVVVLSLLAACSRSEPAAAGSMGNDRANLVNGDAPTETLPVVNAAQLISRARALHGAAVLINAWATWCGSCEHELPMLQKLADTYAARGVRVLLVSVNEPHERNEVSSFLKEHHIAMPSYLAAGPLSDFKAGLNPRWPGMLPASFLFDGSGKLRYFWGGEAFESEVVPVVEGLLAGKNIDGEATLGLAPGATTQGR